MFITKAAVVGAGSASGQIAQSIAAAGIEVVLKDVDPELVGKGLDLDGLGAVDLVVEAVAERIEVKQALFSQLDAATPGHAILASTTSSLSISEIADATLRPDKVVGLHLVGSAVEVVRGEDTSTETITAALAFAQAIRRSPITCEEVPGFVVHRILAAGLSELWRVQDEQGVVLAADDVGLGAAPDVPADVVDLLHAAYDLEGEDRFRRPSGGDGAAGRPDDAGVARLADLVALRMVCEACLVLAEGVATHRDIDVGMMAGAGLDPRRGLFPPFMRADADGLDGVLERLEAAAERHGPRFAPPTILRRLVAQGRLGQASGQGFYAYPQVDAEPVGETVQLETRADGVAIAWLSNPPMNSLAPKVVEDLQKVWDVVGERGIRALVVASANPLLFCAGADIKAFTTLDEAGGRALLDAAHGVLRAFGQGPVTTIAAVNGLAFGGGCELAMACDVRIAARSALFGQPEVKLGIIPGFGGTQRLPRLVGTNKALEMNLVGDPITAEEAFEFGLVNRTVPDHELLDTALAWARKLAGQAPLAVAAIKDVSGAGDLDEGIAAEKGAFDAIFASEDAREGIGAFLAKRPPVWQGR